MPGALPRHQTAHAALRADILDILHASSPAAKDQSAPPLIEELSPGELRVLRYLPTNLSRPEIAGELSVSLNTVSTHLPLGLPTQRDADIGGLLAILPTLNGSS